MNKYNWKKIALISAFSIILLASAAPLVYAQVSPSVYPPDVGLPGSTHSSVRGIIQDIIMEILLPIVGIIAVLFIIIGGFQYITSAGNDEQAERGKKTLQNAVIGLIIVILSYVIVNIVIDLLDRV